MPIAKRYEESLTDNFFVTADFLLKQAELQNNDMVIAALNGTIRTAMDIKSKHLRPEIRFLNKILLHGTPESRRPILQDESTLEILKMNDGYTFTFLESMITDSEAGMKRGNLDDRQTLHDQLLDIRQELKALLDDSAA